MSARKNEPNVDDKTSTVELLGEINALKSIIAILISHIALAHRSPIEKREEIIISISSMLPSALAMIEKNSLPAAAAGFEQAVEQVSAMARHAVRIERVPPKTTVPSGKA